MGQFNRPDEEALELGPDQAELLKRYHEAAIAARTAQAECACLRERILAWADSPNWVGMLNGRPVVSVHELQREVPDFSTLRAHFPEAWVASLKRQTYRQVSLREEDLP